MPVSGVGSGPIQFPPNPTNQGSAAFSYVILGQLAAIAASLAIEKR